jgi:hypothetical protein
LIHLGSHFQILMGYSAGIMGCQLHVQGRVANIQIGMMLPLFGQFREVIDGGDELSEAGIADDAADGPVSPSQPGRVLRMRSTSLGLASMVSPK